MSNCHANTHTCYIIRCIINSLLTYGFNGENIKKKGGKESYKVTDTTAFFPNYNIYVTYTKRQSRRAAFL